MATIPTKISTRIADGLKRFQPIIDAAKTRDINESDTVVILTGFLSEILGYDKYSEITTEHAIRGTYCDLAITIDGKFRLLIEAKAVGIELKDHHVKQSIDYAANKGLDWVILTNAGIWKIFKVHFTKPIQHELLAEVNMLKLSHKNQDDIEMLYRLSKEGILRSSLEDFHIQKQVTNRFLLGNVLLSENIINGIRKELKQIYPDIKVQNEEIKNVLSAEVIKRELLDGEEAIEARKKIQRAAKKKVNLQRPVVAGDPTNSSSTLDYIQNTNIEQPPSGISEVSGGTLQN